MRILFLVLCSLSAGCSLLGGTNADTAAKYGARLVTEYCNNITVPEIRADIRARVNAQAAPHHIEITCNYPSSVAPSTTPETPVTVP